VSGHAALERELTGVGLVFLSMTVGGLVFSGLRLPPLLGYLAAGLASQWLLRPFPSLLLLSTIGVILVFFFLGMEFEWQRLLTAPYRLLSIALNFALNFCLPFGILWLACLPAPAAFFAAMAFYPTSSVITLSALYKARRLANPETEAIVWVSVGEDVTVMFLLAIASGLTRGEANWGNVLTAFAFIAVMAVASLTLTRPLERLFERVPKELDNLVVFTLILIISAFAFSLHLSEALGAFLAGQLLTRVREREELEARLHLLREIGIAAFFFTFGLQIPLRLSAEGMLWGLMLLLLGIATKLLTAWGIGIWETLRPRPKRRLLFCLWVRGEFSIVALSLGKPLLPPPWREALQWFVLSSILVGLVALFLADRFVRR